MEFIDEFLPTENSRIKSIAHSVQPLPSIVTGRVEAVNAETGTAYVVPDSLLPPLPEAKPIQGLCLHPNDRCLIAFAGQDIRNSYILAII